MAGLCSNSVRQAAVVNWMLLGVYFTRELLHKMKKARTPNCLGCSENAIETLNHLLLHCEFFKNIRESYLPQYLQQNKHVSDILDNEELIMQMILDPLSSKLPGIVTTNWMSVKAVYNISRQLCYNINKKREKFYSELDEKT